MRAALLEEAVFKSGETVVVDGAKLHHLLNVARVKINQEILLLDGKGAVASAVVKKIEKRKMELEVETTQQSDLESNFDIAFGMPKKEAFEFCLRACVETGASRIFVVKSERSQSYPLKEDRVKNILVAGVEQSNNPFLPDLAVLGMDELPYDKYDYIALASLQEKRDIEVLPGKGLLLIGPEGGFTDQEERLILSKKTAFPLHFPGPILRTQTAIPFFSGALASRRLSYGV